MSRPLSQNPVFIAFPAGKHSHLLLAVVVVAAPAVIGLMNPPRSRAQAQATAPLSFDVASVKALELGEFSTRPERSLGRFTWTTQLHYLVGYAYTMPLNRISGPIPDGQFVYRVDATTSADATEEQVRLMLQSLLADRFKMVAHRTTKEADVYALSIAKNGPKIHEAKAEDPPPPMPDWYRNGRELPADAEGKMLFGVPAGMDPGVGVVSGRRVSMAQFCDYLQYPLHAPVLDETGLKGSYYFALRYAVENAPLDVNAPPLVAAIQENLGLKLEKRKGTVETLVVDHIEKMPTEN
jgi:uncharacterized protein (TIGR03435 family)